MSMTVQWAADFAREIIAREVVELDNVSRKLDTPPMDPLTRLRDATKAREEAESEWRDAIRDAMDAKARTEQGYSVADVVTAAGVSRPRVYQIASEEDE